MKYIPMSRRGKKDTDRLHEAVPSKNDRTPYVYFLIKNSKIVYIGQTRSARRRCYFHNCYISPDYIRFIKCPLRKLDLYERRWILKFNPIHNRHGISERLKKNRTTEPIVKRIMHKRRVEYFTEIVHPEFI